jgi:hypothetical protein
MGYSGLGAVIAELADVVPAKAGTSAPQLCE